MNDLPKTIDDYTANLNSGTVFAQSNWGDGEWQIVLGWEGRNCDGVEYTPALRADLIKALDDHGDHYHSINPGKKIVGDVVTS